MTMREGSRGRRLAVASILVTLLLVAPLTGVLLAVGLTLSQALTASCVVTGTIAAVVRAGAELIKLDDAR